MPLRLAGSILASAPRRQCIEILTQRCVAIHSLPASARASFHSTRLLRDEQIDKASNHYEALKLQPGATPADIKKSFYKLSKAHHPDHNRNDPNASKRFMRISEAYSTLSIPARRAAYDRDTMNIGHSAPARQGSYSSTGPAGGRPASGLSRRRGSFRGPPPSFYRSGGWGGHSEKRGAAHSDSTGGAAGGGAKAGDHWSASSSSSSSYSSTGSSNTGSSPGMGPGQDPFWHNEDVPHFDRQSHEKTGRNQEARRSRRRSDIPADVLTGDGGTSGSFVLITGCLLFVLLIPLTVRQTSAGKKTNAKEAKTAS